MAKKPKDTGNVKSDDVAEYYNEYSEMMGQIARIRQKIAVTSGRYENMGVPVKAVRACYRLAHMDEPAQWMQDIMRSAAILKIIPTEVENDGQMSFVPALKVVPMSPKQDARVRVARCEVDGYNSGLAGGKIEANPFNDKPGSEEFVSWRDGWADGNKAYEAKQAAKPKNTTQAPTEVRKRGRPPKNPPTQLQKDEAAYRGVDLPDAAE